MKVLVLIITGFVLTAAIVGSLLNVLLFHPAAQKAATDAQLKQTAERQTKQRLIEDCERDQASIPENRRTSGTYVDCQNAYK